MEKERLIRAAALWGAVGFLVSLFVIISGSMFPDLLRPSGNALPWHIAVITMHMLMLASIVGLALSGAAGSSPAARIALGTALLGQGSFAVDEVIGTVSANDLGQTLYLVSVLLVMVGMIATGIAVLREKRWEGWHAWTPLIWGLYPFVLSLLIAVFGEWAYIGTTVWGVPSLLLSIALWQEAGGQQKVQSQFARS